VQEFQRKVQSNSITQQQYENEQARLAKLQQAPLSPEDMTKFIVRSNDLMLLLAEEK